MAVKNNITTIEFIEYLQKLAVEGETSLIVKQKPVLVKGEVQYHGDGTEKYTWPSFLPNQFKPGGAWYGNTGSFILDRFKDGKVSASSANCEFCSVLVLDDVGSKSKTPPIEPTWIMETSPDNYQWGYVFSEQPTKGEFTAAIKAIADAGFTDAGATNAVRNFRLPGSVNLKAGKAGFESKLIEFHPEREFTLDQICNALDVVPSDAATASVRPINLDDDGDDDLLQWISDQGMLLESANQSGWYGVTCPNAAEHSDGNSMARYHPVNRAFVCYHGHCEGFGSKQYLDWAAENGAPRHQPGVRAELLSTVMADALAKLKPTEKFQDASARLAEIEFKELGRLEKEDWWERFAYLTSDDAYYDLKERVDLSRPAFNALYRHINCRSIHTARKIEASTCFDENRQAHGSKALTGLIYAAGEEPLLGRGSNIYGNKWIDGRPSIEGEGGDITPWLNHCRALVPEPAELEHVWDVMAFKLQNPKTKINHGILHISSSEGVGKDLMWQPFIWAVCGNDNRNLSIVDADKLQSQFNYYVESEIIVLNELKEPESAVRRALSNKLKPLLAAPPDVIDVNRKGRHPYVALNRAFVLAFSNEAVPLSISSADRRWFCINSTLPPMEKVAPGSGLKLYQWYRNGGFENIAAWLHKRDVSKFNAGGAPMMTDFKANLLENGMSSLEASIVEMIQNKQIDFARGVIGSPLHNLCDRIADILNMPRTKVPTAALIHALKEAGWLDCGRLASHDQPNKKQIYASPETVASYTKSDLRRMVEQLPEPKAVILNMQRSA